MAKKNILITGGSGLIGKSLTKRLLQKGYNVSHLGRKPGTDRDVKTFLWNVDKKQIDEQCLDGVDTIIHLAGAGIAEKRWTEKRKKILIDSRTQSIGLLYDLMRRKQNTVKSIISASATGYYSDRGDELMTEDSTPAHDFLGECCIAWENAVDTGAEFGVRILKFRTGVVLTRYGGALPQLALPVKLLVGSPIGTGNQWIPWIHWQDVIGLYLYGVENQELSGVFNMVAPQPVTNAEMTIAVAKQLRKPLWAPKVPAFLLKLLLGEMSLVVLGSTKVSAKKIMAANYPFKFTQLAPALQDIYK